MSVFAETRAKFHLPNGVIYLDGNSLGPLPVAAGSRIDRVVADEWGELLVTAWNKAGWMQQPTRIGDRIGKLIGAPSGSVVMGDTLSIKVYQALAAALDLRPDRKVVLSDTGNFPSDLYMAEGLLAALGRGHELRLVEPEDVETSINDDVAVLMLTEVDYRTGRLHDMARLTGKAHGAGAVTVWDLAHSAGALPVNVSSAGADFAVGCTYKYLNGGPGAPAFIYVKPELADTVRPALSGWLGHEAPFAFDLDYRAGPGIERMRVGTPPVIALAALDAALDVFEMVSMADIRARSIELSELFVREVERRCPELVLGSPRNSSQRGSQVSFHYDEGYAAMQALIERGVIGDFRAPDTMRFGFAPLYISTDDVVRAAVEIESVVRDRLWDEERFKSRRAVT